MIWKVSCISEHGFIIQDTASRMIAFGCANSTTITSEESAAHAHLIAAAPDLLEALLALLDIAPMAKDEPTRVIHERAVAAIYKAEQWQVLELRQSREKLK